MSIRTSVVFAFCMITLTGPSVQGQGKGARGWLSSLSEGKAQAGRSGKPIMVVLRCQP